MREKLEREISKMTAFKRSEQKGTQMFPSGLRIF